MSLDLKVKFVKTNPELPTPLGGQPDWRCIQINSKKFTCLPQLQLVLEQPVCQHDSASFKVRISKNEDIVPFLLLHFTEIPMGLVLYYRPSFPIYPMISDDLTL